MSPASQGHGPETRPRTELSAHDDDPPGGSSSAGLVAVATDVGAWRIVEPVLHEVRRRGVPFRVLLAEPAAGIARQDGVPHGRLDGPTVDRRAEQVLAARPDLLLLGTSVQDVVERALTRRLRGAARPGPAVPTLALLDAMLFVERRFGAGLSELADVVACPDAATAERLARAGAPASALVVTGNPTLEWIARRAADLPPAPDPATGPLDVLFVSSPVAGMRLRGATFAIDEREALDDLLDALAGLPELAPHGCRVRVRLHPVQRPDALPPPPPGLALELDLDPDRLRSCAQARVVVGLSSTLLGEARFLPRPAVAYLPGPFWEHERVFAPEYGVPLARSAEHLRALLRAALREPCPPAPTGHVGAAARIADLLAALAPTRG